MVVAHQTTHMSALITCGHTTGKANLLLDVGKKESAPMAELSGCLMEEPSNGSATPTQRIPQMVWKLLTDW
jgi:hypothetical protein